MVIITTWRTPGCAARKTGARRSTRTERPTSALRARRGVMAGIVPDGGDRDRARVVRARRCLAAATACGVSVELGGNGFAEGGWRRACAPSPKPGRISLRQRRHLAEAGAVQ